MKFGRNLIVLIELLTHEVNSQIKLIIWWAKKCITYCMLKVNWCELFFTSSMPSHNSIMLYCGAVSKALRLLFFKHILNDGVKPSHDFITAYLKQLLNISVTNHSAFIDDEFDFSVWESTKVTDVHIKKISIQMNVDFDQGMLKYNNCIHRRLYILHYNSKI